MRGAVPGGETVAVWSALAREGAFGVGILEVENEAEAREFGENDPSVLAGLNRFEIARCGSRTAGNRE
ncbi:MAG: hypothetical protein WA476_18075 [Acidobacteriaceae bacterium]